MLDKEQENKVQEQVLNKRKKYKEQGFADKDFEKTLDGKHFKIWLPSSVFEQQKLINLASRLFSGNLSFQEESELTTLYYNYVCKHAHLDGKPVNAEVLGLEQLQAFALFYWVELLFPLSLWSDEKTKELMLS
jgi:hypothetical protein